ncbi:glycosyltransferase family 9 protein [Campylobacter gastrosuis]|uniref:Glycosyltransferase family 9 protein n=1 Tax=Campylobacter gastrosuis TaxID=2974576 RepID=A0ABT7HM43_9BACT|nr:glycosyltransferase family 9 protein [Campylobacter gastrosuis]MDL0087800.1 glycosyltransferase family 9 protein [Campylobacter gastrosuis]MDL0088011.1 glycosyltransferase family 9 protein [Campylobacter gastrosuis]
MKIFEEILKATLKNKSAVKTELVSEPFKVVCFFSNTAIGDTLFNTPVFRAFKEKFPNVKTIALLNPKNMALFENNPNLDEIIPYNGRWNGFLKALKILKTKNIDICFLLHSNDPQATPLAILSGAKYVFKIPNLKNEFNFLHSNTPKYYDEFDKYVVLGRLKQLEFIGLKNTNTKFDLYLNASDYQRVDNILKKDRQTKFIGFQMGASVRAKYWVLKHWIELARLVLNEPNTKIVLTGSPSERTMTNELFSVINDERVLNLAGVFNVREAAALIDRLDILITPDTGPLHIAVALNTPLIGLFGVTSPELFMPNYGQDIFKFIKADFNIDDNFSRHKDYSHVMEKITAKEVFDNVKRIIFKN